MKKFLSFVICFAMLLSMLAAFPVISHAETESGRLGANLTWTYDSESAQLTISGSGKMIDFEYGQSLPWFSWIESLVIEEGVTSIGNYAFYGCELKSVKLPSTLEQIGSNAFEFCMQLAEIDIPDGTPVMTEGNAFFNCNSLPFAEYGNAKYISTKTNPYFALYELTDYEITSLDVHPDTVAVVGSAACYAETLESVTFGDKLKTIGYGAFGNCTALSAVTLPAGLVQIGLFAFAECTSLNTIEIPDGVRVIYDRAFYGCTSLTEISVPDSVASVGDYAFYGVPDSAFTVYGNGAYLGNEGNPYHVLAKSADTSASTLTVHDGAKIIADRAFFECKDLASVALSESVRHIGYMAFGACYSLTEIDLKCVESIDDYAFSDCRYLERITLSEELKAAGWEVFYDCNSIEYNTYCGAKYLGSADNPYFALAKSGYEYASSCEIHPDCEVILYCAFAFNDILSVRIPHGMRSIGPSAFGSCSQLTDVYYDGVEDEWAQIYIDTTRTYDYSGSRFVYNTNAPIIDAVKHYKEKTYFEGECGDGVFWSFDKMTKELTVWGSGRMYDYDLFANLAPWDEFRSEIQRATVKTGVTYVGWFALSDCPILTSVTLEDGVDTIGIEAFSNCPSLSDIIIPDSIKTVDLAAFDGCTSLYYYTFNNAKYLGNQYNRYALLVKAKDKNITSCNVHANTKAIGYQAFEQCKSLLAIEIPSGVKRIGNEAFYSCTALKTVTLHEGLEDIGVAAFNYCSALEAIDIPEGVTSINMLFSQCTNLKSVGIPSTVVKIEVNSFSDCSSLESIVLPDAIESIEMETFSRCTSLKSVNLPQNIKYIDQYAFYECTSLEEAIIPDGVTEIGRAAFFGCSSIERIRVPSGMTFVGEDAFITLSDKLAYNEYGSAKYLGNEANPYVLLVMATDPSLGTYVVADGTERIMESAFSSDYATYYGASNVDCTGMTAIVIPDSMKVVSFEAFFGLTGLADVYYKGTREEWEKIEILYLNDPLTNAAIHFKGDPHDHFWDDGAVVSAASYTSDGETVFTCRICGETRSEIIPRIISTESGDANGDGDLNMKDVLLMRRDIAGLSDVEDVYFTNADIVTDGDLNMKDVLKARRIIAGLD